MKQKITKRKTIEFNRNDTADCLYESIGSTVGSAKIVEWSCGSESISVQFQWLEEETDAEYERRLREEAKLKDAKKQKELNDAYMCYVKLVKSISEKYM